MRLYLINSASLLVSIVKVMGSAKTATECGGRAAAKQGIVPGGGVAYMRAMKVLEKVRFSGVDWFGVKLVKCGRVEPIS